jgi:hypothetical protein
MFLVEWEFLPAAGRTDEFVAAYGADGPWVALFRRADGYLGTDLVALSERPGWFRTVDRWTSPQAYAAFRSAYAAEYRAVDLACERLTAEERPVNG